MRLLRDKSYYAFAIYSLLFVTAIVTFGGIIITQEKVMKANSVHSTSHIAQIAVDWEQAPMTDIVVLDSTVCPDGYTDMYA